jgi:hypothetical protein
MAFGGEDDARHQLKGAVANWGNYILYATQLNMTGQEQETRIRTRACPVSRGSSSMVEQRPTPIPRWGWTLVV